MNWLRLHWFDVGIVLALITAGYVLSVPLAPLSLVLWLNLIALFLHQFEEYRYPGTFPGMLNAALFGSRQPDRYPLNTNSALIVNVAIGWVAYLLAALLAAQAAWLGIAVMLVSLGNLLAHTLLFNIRAKRFYNPGMATALLLFAPLVVRFAQLLRTQLFPPTEWILGLALGATLNYVGILKLIDWLKDEDTPFIFPSRFLPRP